MTEKEMTTVAILQPSVWPWLGYCEQVWRSDVFVFLDDVQMTRGDWRNRNRIKTPGGWEWLTVPVLRKGKFGQRICDVEVNNMENWRVGHLKALRQNYARAPFFRRYYPQFEEFYGRQWEMLEDVAEESTVLAARLLGMEREFVCSKTLEIGGERTERLVEICRHFGASTYYSGRAAWSVGRLDVERFEEIKVEIQDYQHPTYRQLWGPFLSHLSVIDLLFNEGPRSLAILTGERTCVFS